MQLHRRLALGTVQFGVPYGIANRSGQVSRSQARAILEFARRAGLDTLDTAIAYGDSERRLGEIGVKQWRVISKLPPILDSGADVAIQVPELVIATLERLRIPRLQGLLLHRSQDLLGAQGSALYRAMTDLKNQGRIEKLGVSIYGPEELDALWPEFRFDLVQAPFNVLDRRLETSGWLARLHHAGTEIHTRSAFLQGLLLMMPQTRPAMFLRWHALWGEWHKWLDEQSLTPLQACLGFVTSRLEIDRIVVGVDSLEQLREIIASADLPAAVPPEALMSGDLKLIDPSRWNDAGS